MNIIIWIISGILAALFGMIGIMKTTQPKEKLATKLPIVNEYSMGIVRFIGISELLGAIGLIVPYLTGIAPFLTPIAASCLIFIMILATLYHLHKHEYKGIVFNVVLLILLVMVAYYRFQN